MIVIFFVLIMKGILSDSEKEFNDNGYKNYYDIDINNYDKK